VDTGRGSAGRKSLGRGDSELSMEEDCTGREGKGTVDSMKRVYCIGRGGVLSTEREGYGG
jgi:hypothetical protein